MRPRVRSMVGVAGPIVAWLALPAGAGAQAFTPPQGVGGVTLAWQYIDNLGHRFTDGSYLARGQSVSTSLLLEVEYGVSDRLSATLGVPYVFARYTGSLVGTPVSQPRDLCRCWNSGLADFSASVRYRFGGDTWAVTPVAQLGVPSHGYPFRGEAVVGKQLNELQLGVLAGRRLVGVLPRASIQAGYTYAFVERPIDEIRVDRSNLFVDLGYAVNRRIYLRGGWVWQHTHGGLRAGSPVTGQPFPPPGEINTPDRVSQADRLRAVQVMQLGGGLSVNLGPVDVFAQYVSYIWGRDAHNSRVYGLGVSWYFGLPE